MAYGFRKYAVLEFTLPNGKKVRSNVFTKRDFNAKYTVYLSNSGIRVEEK